MSFKKNEKAEGKVDLTLFPMDAFEGICRILQFGAAKHGRDNWREGVDDPDAQRRILAAMMRHYAALQRGETLDLGEGGSGESHVLHMACNAVFLAAFSEVQRRRALKLSASEPDPWDEAVYEDAEKINQAFEARDGDGVPCGDPRCNTCYDHVDPDEIICGDPNCEICF